jgi:UDP-N-acetylglucosamine 2-epimerase
MVKIFVASFNRSSDGALEKLVKKMKSEDMYAYNIMESDYVLACGDRSEVFDFTVQRFRENRKIIHLWAGEISQGTHDEVYRHSITLMSRIQLVTTERALKRVERLCNAVGKDFDARIIGNVMLDNLEVDETGVPSKQYDLVLYNPPTSMNTMEDELNEIVGLIDKCNYIWLPANGDIGSDIVNEHVNEVNLSRPLFLGLLKNCRRFITNSSCQYYEAPFLIDRMQIVSIGVRNENRESGDSDMTIEGASENIMKVFRELE